MANFNTDAWYQITRGAKTQSLDGAVLNKKGVGATFFRITNTSEVEQNWQFFPYSSDAVNGTAYVLRNRGSGPHSYLTAGLGNASDPNAIIGNTVPNMRNYTIADESMFWYVGTWPDGTFYLYNQKNGSDWHLQVKQNSFLVLSSNITAPQSGQALSFKQLNSIENNKYSSLLTASGSSTGTNTAPAGTSTSTSTSLPTPSSSSSGLSTGAKAGIGAGVGIVALAGLLALLWFLMRRRKRHTTLAATNKHQPEETKLQTYTDPGSSGPAYSELHSEHSPPYDHGQYASELGGTQRHKSGGNHVSELGATERQEPVELPVEEMRS